jgi:hypothetical protein
MEGVEAAERVTPMGRVMNAFFNPSHGRLPNTIAVLCESHTTSHKDPVTQTILIMLKTQLQIQLTAVGLQPFKGRDLTFPYQKMSAEQKECLKQILTDEQNERQWGVYEHAISYRHKAATEPAQNTLTPLDVLQALCTTILKSVAYPDRRMRVAVCNILLQRVQANIAVDKHTLRELNNRLFPTPPEKEK